MLLRASLALAVLLALVFWALPAVTAAPAAEPGLQKVTMMLPNGDPAAGRVAFQVLKCTTCHRVAGQADLPAPVSSNRGPSLGPVTARKPAGEIASSIVAPSHTLSDGRKRAEGRLSPMGDFSQAMTVRQLSDLVAYLRSLDSKPAK
jgi:mono/diheme cytochrome c family protein